MHGIVGTGDQLVAPTMDNTNIYRKSIRLKNYDYSQMGAYFVTVCAHNRQCLFGEINNNKMVLNDYGNIISEEWLKTPAIRNEIRLDGWVVMPNHFHGIVLVAGHQGDRLDQRLWRPRCRELCERPVAPTIHAYYK